MKTLFVICLLYCTIAHTGFSQSWSPGAELIYANPINTRIGIGTSSPVVSLDVRGKLFLGEFVTHALSIRSFNLISKDARVRMIRYADDQAPGVEMLAYDANTTTLKGFWDFFAGCKTYLPGKFVIRDRTNGLLNRFVIDQNGNVGISNDNPAAKLHVAGNTIIDGTLYTSGKIWGQKK